MDYQQSLDYLYGLQRFGIKLGLANIHELLARLGHPEKSLRIVHVAGTNGKGSVSAAVAQMLQTAGYRTGLYTSPHLHSFTERIRINGAPIDKRDQVALIRELREQAEGLPITFFEFITAMALLHFKRKGVAYAVLEVGMGGRLDATNAVSPALSVITPICCDHAEYLGPDLAAIAAEKAGIIKPGVPVVIASQQPSAQRVLLDRARKLGAPVYLWDRDFRIAVQGETFDFAMSELTLRGLHPGLAGGHQRENLAVALAAAAVLRRQGSALPESALRAGVEQVRWPGRLEWWGDRREVLLDGAHNRGGAEVLACYLRDLGVRVRWVCGIKGQRRPEDILGPLLPYTVQLYATLPPVDQGVEPVKLVQTAGQHGIPGVAFDSVREALSAALCDRKAKEVVLVAGSLFVVAAGREYLMDRGGNCEIQ